MEPWQQSVDIKLDRILNELEFIKKRSTIYLGRNEALTYLADETPIFINTDDLGCPINFMNGGDYEEDYFKVFQSFRKPGLPMLDVGANLGVYSLRMASFMRKDRIYSFEPIPRIRNLFLRSVFLNGFSDQITMYPFAVSDREGIATLNVPVEHAGGASLEASGGVSNGVTVDVKRLDDLFPDDFVCGLVKLDVEGHELHALRGMRSNLARSKDAIVMFEKLSNHSGIEKDIFDFFALLGWGIYEIQGRRLVKVDHASFESSGGYFLAARPYIVDAGFENRDYFHIYPVDLHVINGSVIDEVLYIDSQIAAGSVVFHGPYWLLSKGYYRMTINGKLDSRVTLELCERFGYKTTSFELEPHKLTFDFPVHRDLIKFELVMRATTNCKLVASISNIKLEKIG